MNYKLKNKLLKKYTTLLHTERNISFYCYKNVIFVTSSIENVNIRIDHYPNICNSWRKKIECLQ